MSQTSSEILTILAEASGATKGQAKRAKQLLKILARARSVGARGIKSAKIRASRTNVPTSKKRSRMWQKIRAILVKRPNKLKGDVGIIHPLIQ